MAKSYVKGTTRGLSAVLHPKDGSTIAVRDTTTVGLCRAYFGELPLAVGTTKEIALESTVKFLREVLMHAEEALKTARR